jgi:hypothetical protein
MWLTQSEKNPKSENDKGGNYFGDLDVDGRIDMPLKPNFSKEFLLLWTALKWFAIEFSGEHGKGHSGSVKNRILHDQLVDCQLLKKSSAP